MGLLWLLALPSKKADAVTGCLPRSRATNEEFLTDGRTPSSRWLWVQRALESESVFGGLGGWSNKLSHEGDSMPQTGARPVVPEYLFSCLGASWLGQWP